MKFKTLFATKIEVNGERDREGRAGSINYQSIRRKTKIVGRLKISLKLKEGRTILMWNLHHF